MKNVNKKRNKWLIPGIIIAVVVILILWYVGTYNSFIGMENNIEGNWAEIENQYKRRADLIPNLIETVQGAADFESGTQTEIAELRTAAVAAKQKWNDASTTQEQIAAAKEVDGVASRFSGLNINVENYPQLKATANFQSLQDELANTENKVAVSRMRYNDAVKVFNTKIRQIPANIVAGAMGLEKQIYFEVEESDMELPEVEFE